MSETLLFTDDGYRIVQPGIAQHEACTIPTKSRQVQSTKGEYVCVAWTMQDRLGRPIDLNATLGLTAESSVSASEPTFAIKGRITGCDPLCGQIYEVTGDFVDPANGLVRVCLPPALADMGGLYRLSVAVTRTDGEAEPRPIIINPGIWSVEEGSWGNTSNRTGIPTLSELRLHLRDTPVENGLLDEVEFDDEELLGALLRPIQQWNEMPPPVAVFSCSNFPFRYHWLQATVAELLRTAAHHYLRNNLKVQHGGVSGNIKDKANEYLQLSQLYREEWLAFVEHKKVEINATLSVTSMGSQYGAGW